MQTKLGGECSTYTLSRGDSFLHISISADFHFLVTHFCPAVFLWYAAIKYLGLPLNVLACRQVDAWIRVELTMSFSLNSPYPRKSRTSAMSSELIFFSLPSIHADLQCSRILIGSHPDPSKSFNRRVNLSLLLCPLSLG
jgi:hypothetical protein